MLWTSETKRNKIVFVSVLFLFYFTCTASLTADRCGVVRCRQRGYLITTAVGVTLGLLTQTRSFLDFRRCLSPGISLTSCLSKDKGPGAAERLDEDVGLHNAGRQNPKTTVEKLRTNRLKILSQFWRETNGFQWRAAERLVICRQSCTVTRFTPSTAK